MPAPPLKPRRLMRRLFRFATGVDIEDLRRQREELSAQGRLLHVALSNPHAGWLYRNRAERMDATVEEIFDPLRRKFHLARYRFAAGRARGCRVGDLACGCGYGSRLICDEGGAASCVGVDLDPEAVAYATAVHGAPNVEFVTRPGTDTALPSESFDLLVSFETIEHVPEPTALLAEFHRLLRPGGTLIISTPNDWDLEVSEFHLQQFTRESFRSALVSKFEILEWWAQNSGSPTPYNRGQPARLVPGTEETLGAAEVFVVVCEKR